MSAAPYTLNHRRREIVLESLSEICQYRHWILLAAQIGTGQVQAVLSAETMPVEIIQKLKAYASRKLNTLSIGAGEPRQWARSGTSQILSTTRQVSDSIAWVTADWGEPTAVWQARRFPPRAAISSANYRETISPMYTASRLAR